MAAGAGPGMARPARGSRPAAGAAGAGPARARPPTRRRRRGSPSPRTRTPRAGSAAAAPSRSSPTPPSSTSTTSAVRSPRRGPLPGRPARPLEGADPRGPARCATSPRRTACSASAATAPSGDAWSGRPGGGGSRTGSASRAGSPGTCCWSGWPPPARSSIRRCTRRPGSAWPRRWPWGLPSSASTGAARRSCSPSGRTDPGGGGQAGHCPVDGQGDGGGRGRGPRRPAGGAAEAGATAELVRGGAAGGVRPGRGHGGRLAAVSSAARCGPSRAASRRSSRARRRPSARACPCTRSAGGCPSSRTPAWRSRDRSGTAVPAGGTARPTRPGVRLGPVGATSSSRSKSGRGALRTTGCTSVHSGPSSAPAPWRWTIAERRSSSSSSRPRTEPASIRTSRPGRSGCPRASTPSRSATGRSGWSSRCRGTTARSAGTRPGSSGSSRRSPTSAAPSRESGGRRRTGARCTATWCRGTCARTAAAGPWLVDWEDAGWGPPAADAVRYLVASHSLRVASPLGTVQAVREAFDIDQAGLADIARFWLRHRNLRPVADHPAISREKARDATRATREIARLPPHVRRPSGAGDVSAAGGRPGPARPGVTG